PARPRGAEGPAVDSESADRRREHPEDLRRFLQDQGRRHVLEEAPGEHRTTAPDRDVPGQGNDAKELAGNRRTVRWPRPYDSAARGAQDLRRAAEEHRAEPATARARTDAEGMSDSARRMSGLVKQQPWGQLSNKLPVVHNVRTEVRVMGRESRLFRARPHRVRRNLSAGRKRGNWRSPRNQ